MWLGTQVAAAAEVEPDSPVAAVEKLYADFAWEAVLSRTPRGRTELLQLPREGLERYFTPKIVALLERDDDCGRRTHEICRLDYLPHWSSQDPYGATEVEFHAVQGEATTVAVKFNYASSGHVVNLRYRLERTSAGWRIADIVDNDNGASLATVLEADHEEPRD